MPKLQTDVLICGAGPTGLMMAIQLKRFGVDSIVIDPKPGIVKESRALAVQARTLQIYEQMGIATKALQQGAEVLKIKVIINGKRTYEVPLNKLGMGATAFPFLFILEQNKNEKLLYDHLQSLGGNVTWQHSLESFTQDNDGIIAIADNAAGEQIEIKASWLIGADGARSQVRHQLEMPFKGGTYENIFIVADTHAQWPWGHDCLSLCLTANGFAGLFPMQGENRYRVIGTFPKKYLPGEVTEFSQIQEAVQKQIKIDVEFTNTNWFSVYHVHHRCVERFSKDRVFLAGDAAHVHSPAGGQGMNTGLQDAYNLGWKLALVIKQQASEEILQSYNEERLPVARRLLKTTDRAFKVVTSGNWVLKFLRLNIIPPFVKKLISIRSFGRFAYKGISQIGINYKKSFLSQSESTELLEAGALIPYTNLNGKQIDEYLKFDGITILVFGSLLLHEDQDEKLQQSFQANIQFIEIMREEKNEDAFAKFKVKSTAVFLIRPDNYIGYSSENISFDAVRKYMKEKLRLVAVAL
jgi:2-polyprenyl-6-methoxyphenol hydroxylase-like FAD-dependent oxidoreductase